MALATARLSAAEAFADAVRALLAAAESPGRDGSAAATGADEVLGPMTAEVGRRASALAMRFPSGSTVLTLAGNTKHSATQAGSWAAALARAIGDLERGGEPAQGADTLKALERDAREASTRLASAHRAALSHLADFEDAVRQALY
jgi:hypothetical protein